MDTLRVLTGIVSVCLLLTVVSSVRADSVHSAKVDFGAAQALGLPNMSKTEFRDFLVDQLDAAEFGGILADRFEGNNGLHLGWFKADNNEKNTGSAAGNGSAGNNGKHIGFSVSVFNPGMKFGLMNPRQPSPQVTQNPEPTGMLLLGTGLAAAAGFARRRARRRRQADNN